MKRYIALAALLLTTHCTTVYYSTWEKLGKEKRDLLRDNISYAKNEQKEVSEEFKDALTHLKEVYGLEGGNLEKSYTKVKASYENAEDKSSELKSRIDRVETIGNDLFKEWASEINQMENADYKRQSKIKLDDTKKKFNVMFAALENSYKTVPPVMRKLNDQVLFLKHNLNAQALGSLRGEVVRIEQDINKLQQEMVKSISESEKFIKEIKD
jgi:hypothetical protein